MVSLERYVSLLEAAMANFRLYSYKHRKRKGKLLARISKIDINLKKGIYEGMAKIPEEIQELYEIEGDVEAVNAENSKLIDELNRLRADEKAYKSKVKEAKKLRSKWRGTEIMLFADLIRHLRKAPTLINKRLQLFEDEEKLCRRYISMSNWIFADFKESIRRQGGQFTPTMEEMFTAIRKIISNHGYNSVEGQKAIKGMLETLTSVYPTDYALLRKLGTELGIKDIRSIPMNLAVRAVDWVDQLWKKPLKIILIKQRTVKYVLENLKKLGEENKKYIRQMLPEIERNYSIIHQESSLLRGILQSYKGKFNYDTVKSNLDELARLHEQEKEITSTLSDTITSYAKTSKDLLNISKKGYFIAENWMCSKHRRIYIGILVVHTIALLSFYFYVGGLPLLINRIFSQTIVKYQFFARLKYYSPETKQEVEAELEPTLEPQQT